MAVLSKDGEEVARAPLAYAGAPSQFRATLPVAGPGVYEVLAYAWHPASGNAGLDRTTFLVRGE